MTNDGDLRVCKKVIDRFSALAHRFLEITMVISGALALLEAAAIYENAKKWLHDRKRKKAGQISDD